MVRPRRTNRTAIRMYTRASPGLLHITPNLQADENAEATHSSAASEVPVAEDSKKQTAAPSGTSNALLEQASPDVSKEISTGTLLDPSPSQAGPASAFPPLRVGFVSKFFGDEVSDICSAKSDSPQVQGKGYNESS